MNSKSKEKFKSRLLELRSVLTGDISHIEKNALHTPEHVYGIDKISELGSDNFEQEMSLARMGLEQNSLEQVETALLKLDQDDGFGICNKCQNEIDMNRLEAIPYATLCINCQTAEENE